jgi:hypothetical protein
MHVGEALPSAFAPVKNKSANLRGGEKSDKAEYDHPPVGVRYSSLKWNRFSSTKGGQNGNVRRENTFSRGIVFVMTKMSGGENFLGRYQNLINRGLWRQP